MLIKSSNNLGHHRIHLIYLKFAHYWITYPEKRLHYILKKLEEIIVASTLQGWNVHFIKLVDWTEKELMLAGQWLNGIELPLSQWFDLN